MIRILDPIVASQIAAGEVVERPASVIKELVENSLDAGARRVAVDIRGGGVAEMRIQDDGAGIPADQVELAFQRHATSKLATADDLFAIRTLGFRGEALPSIAAVAQITCITRTADQPTGVELRIAGGEIQSKTSTGAPPGTTFLIRNLFYNIPVRREFLRAAGAEAAAIGAVMTQYALAYPHVRFSLSIDGKPRLQTSGSGHLPDVLLSIYGLEVARAMLPLEFSDGGDLTGISAQGLVSPPTLSRSSRDAMHLSINGRAVAARGQVAAILDDAYHTLLMKGRFPYIVMAISLHPGAVDVNVHPTKSEVKFRDPERVRSTLARAIRTVVQRAVVVQGWEGTTVVPPTDPEAEPDWADDRDEESAWNPPAPSALPVDSAAQPAVAPQPLERGAAPSIRHDAAPTPEAVVPTPRQEVAPPVQPSRPAHQATRDVPVQPETPAEPAATPRPNVAATRWESAGPARRDVSPPSVQETQASLTIGADADAEPAEVTPERRGLPRLRALAQLARMYLLAEGPDGDLYLIDQHAAHERITYERLMAQRGAGAVQSQRLLIPQTIPLPPAAQATLLAAAGELATWGFELEEAEYGVQVRAIPQAVALEELKSALVEVADYLSGAGGSTPEAWREQLLTTLSCHTSIRTGHPLTPTEQQGLIEQLSQCHGPRTCPHGRPTVIIVTKQQLTRQFGRLG